MKTVFDNDNYMRINEARAEWLKKIISQIPFKNKLKTALDIACGAGYFSNLLREMDFNVTGMDMRDNNLDVCRKRYPHINFEKINLDENPIKFNTYDLVLIFGILYHLQSPLQTIINLSRSIGKIAIVSTRVASGEKLACYLYEENDGDTNNNRGISSVPTLNALVSMFNFTGFNHIYRPSEQPDHEQWQMNCKGQRHSIVVSREEINISKWILLKPDNLLKKW